MALTEADGTITTTASEQDLFDITTGGPKYFTTIVFLHNMTATETFVFKVYVYDTNATTYRVFQTITITGSQADPAGYMPTLLSSQYKVSVQRTTGTDRAVTWKRFEQT
jgi:phenolic acid decarboxylase